ncbi:hypothetical protein [Limnoglobus roseus]|uniref:S1 motif domain-containing protein n=1 Tax=Limnoglobus roseus TaxID=2598579 RepID=A0A5C1AFG5_9BACT|nr:hypothetical protein [Limnoglobus roseus]QEL15884.1 hypothetical protein PX52LOC_02820 [Limnoglobus roseus]
MAWDGDIRVHFPDWGTDAGQTRWPEVRSRLAVGQAVRGEVVCRAPFGVWLDIGSGWPTLLRVPEMAGARERPIRFEEYPPLGTVVEACVLWLGERAEIILCQRPQTPSDGSVYPETGDAPPPPTS